MDCNNQQKLVSRHLNVDLIQTWPMLWLGYANLAELELALAKNAFHTAHYYYMTEPRKIEFPGNSWVLRLFADTFFLCFWWHKRCAKRSVAQTKSGMKAIAEKGVTKQNFLIYLTSSRVRKSEGRKEWYTNRNKMTSWPRNVTGRLEFPWEVLFQPQ